MSFKVSIGAVAFLLIGACQTVGSASNTDQTEAELASCIRTVMRLDVGRWSYMGTIARLNGTFTTYETTSVHALEGPNMWSSKSFGGDVGGNEGDAEVGLVRLVGSLIVPVEDGVLEEDNAVKYLSCEGPDVEGRYESHREYKLPNNDGTFDTAKNVSWHSEHGSYYAEDHFNPAGRIVSRRSGVNTPADD